MEKIKFGTDGWRGVIGDDFTFANVRRVAAAVAEYVRNESAPASGLVIGYDTRFLSADSARVAADVVAAAGSCSRARPGRSGPARRARTDGRLPAADPERTVTQGPRR